MKFFELLLFFIDSSSYGENHTRIKKLVSAKRMISNVALAFALSGIILMIIENELIFNGNYTKVFTVK